MKLRRGFIKKKVIGIFLSILMTSSCVAQEATQSSNIQQVQKILQAGRLANLPKSASDLKVYSWNGLFTGANYVMFHATPVDIKKFLQESLSIKDIALDTYSPEHMYLPYPKNFDSRDIEELNVDHEYFFIHKDWPSWYDPTLKVKGRKYQIPGDPNLKGHNSGSIIINDETNLVYIYIMWS